jgi:hypothetical protein
MITKEKRKMHKHTPYKAALIIMSIILAIFILRSEFLKTYISGLGEWGIIGALISGMFYAYSFTLAPALASLILIAEDIHPMLASFFAAVGATFGCYLLFAMIRHHLPKTSLIEKIKDEERVILKKLKYHWVLPLFVAIIFASPLPDELGVSLLGLAHVNKYKFMALVFALSFIGFLIVLWLAALV